MESISKALIAEILEFWFSEKVKKLWFNSTPEFDEELKEKYLAVYEKAAKGQLDHWKTKPLGALALVVILDQFPLNMFRQQPRSFSTEALSRKVAEYAIDQGFDAELTKEQKVFLYMPFMHSENLADQDRSVALFEKAGLQDNLRFARHHREIVRRFGRFPHRNSILRRESSGEELDYLASKEAFLG